VRLPIIKTVFLKELREMLRDRRSLAVMFGIPLVLYPVLTIALATLGQNRVTGLKEQRYRVIVVNPAGAPELMRRLYDKKSGLEIIERIAPERAKVNPTTSPVSTAAPINRFLTSGLADVVLDIPLGFEPEVIAQKDVALTLHVDRSRTEAEFALRKLNKIIDEYQEWVIAQRLSHFKVPPQVTKGIEQKVEDVATAAQRMGNRLSQLMPLLILITGMLGSLFPALSATTTERELGTLETLLVSPARRTELLVAKGLLVLLCGILTSALNCLSMSLVLWRTFSLTMPNEPLSISFSSLALSFVAALPALAFFTAMVLLVGLLARTFREANSYATPAMLLPIASLALTIADVQPTPGLLVTPIANTTLVMRDILRDRFIPGQFLLASISSFVYAGLLMSIAARLFSNEQLVNPSWEPLSLKGLGGRGASKKRPPRPPAIDEAIALFAAAILLLFYIQPSLMQFGLIPTLIITQVFLIFGPAVILAWLGNWNWIDTFKLREPRAKAVLGAVLLGIGLGPVTALFSYLQQKAWPAPPETQRFLEQLFVPALQKHPFLIPAIVGVFAGVFEELLFRGPIQTALIRKSKPANAIVITAFLFAAAHLDLHGLPLRTVLGVVLGWIVYRSGSIIPAILTHTLYDTTQLAVLAWQIHHDPKSAAASDNTLDPTFWLRFAIGLAWTAVGLYLIHRTARPKSTPTHGFEVVQPTSSF
jgi:membrane protease YdiL (CAAX protease family)/ABC-type Na+ efflux pump permease subunit